MIFRRLPASEWGKLSNVYEECRNEDASPLPKPEQGIIIIAENQGDVVGVVGAERTWAVSPLWVKKDFRGLGLAKRLAMEIKEYNTENLAELLVTTSPHVDLLVFQLGFIPVPGTIWRRT